MLFPDGSQAEGAVLIRVLFAARPEEPEVDQADRGRQALSLARQVATSKQKEAAPA